MPSSVSRAAVNATTRIRSDALFFCSNGRRWCAWPVGDDTFPAEIIFYGLVISVELSLKALLLLAGASDDDNRRRIGHDLAKALTAAAEAGLPPPSSTITKLITIVHPHYMLGGFQRLVRDDWPIGFAPSAIRAAQELNSQIRSMIEHGTVPSLG